MIHKIEIFTDGSCIKNPGPGGYGIIIKKNNKVIIKISSGYYYTTNNRMELIAIIKSIEIINKNFIEKYYIEINTDSLYVINGITKWIINWIKKKWKLSNNKLIKNLDLWKKLYILKKINNLNWNWVKGHSNCLENILCDKLAKIASLNPTNTDINYF